jgi:hypothetical protein
MQKRELAVDNIILSGMLKEFVVRYDLQQESPDRQFEKFTNYCLLKADHYDSFDFDKVGTGECMGIDGVGISIGGVLVDEVEDVEQFTKNQFFVKFYFTQAKTSSSFDLGDFLKFSSTVRLFFGQDEQAIPSQLKKAFEIKKVIYERAAKMAHLPTIELCYAFTGAFNKATSQAAPLIESEIDVLRKIRYLASSVDWRVSDGDELAMLYRETQNDIQREISFQRHVALPGIKGASAAYIGVVKCVDYVGLIKKGNEELNKGLFFENVRDFLGINNPVNEDIASTIHSVDERDRFAILNNGVTIVAKKVTPSGDFFKISQFQVVNGCQTSHVLFKNQSALSDDMYLTVKLIETSDVDLSGQIISTTNSQSLVVKEAFATIKPYHRKLEDFFSAMRNANYIYYYERRPHQYDHQDIRHSLIVTAPALIKSFVSLALEEPHKIHYYYGRLLEEYNRDKYSELFSDSDYPGLYFAAHHIVSKVKGAISKDSPMKEWVFHLALLVKRQVAPAISKNSTLNDKRFLETLERIDKDFPQALQVAVKIISELSLAVKKNRAPDVTQLILDRLGRYLGQRSSTQQIGPILPADNGKLKFKANPLAFASQKTSGDKSTNFVADLAKIKLANGMYSGVVVEHHIERGKIAVGYGPYKVEVTKRPNTLEYPPVGSRMQFEAKAGNYVQVI